ncbi:MAG: glycerol-3-phosphate 1-O-acyltransferase PlsY [bacterium]
MVALNFAIIAFTGYLLGSFPTAIIMGKALQGIDIREHGSGNAGGTNVFRVLGWKPGVAVIVIDMLKGLAATVFAAKIALTDLPFEPIYLQLIAGCSAIIGHIWTVFAGFQGGKGVGTAAGMIFGLFPIAASICLAIFLIIAFSTRYVSLASITAAVALPIILFSLSRLFAMAPPPPLFVLSILLAVLIVYTHRSNIKRLINGTENRFGKRV